MATLKRLLCVEDLVELRELTAFLLKSHFGCEVVEANSGNEAIEILSRDSNFELILSDYNMPDGNGTVLYNYLRGQNLNIPFAIISAKKRTPEMGLGPEVRYYEKPLDADDLIAAVNEALGSTQAPLETSFIPVPISLLKKMKTIKSPLYVQINPKKFVKILYRDAHLSDQACDKYQGRGVTYLYIPETEVETFISDYRQDVLSQAAWAEQKTEEFDSSFKLNTELLRHIGLKASDEVIELTRAHVQTALKIMSRDKKLSQLVHRFHKIEGLGYSDHCALIVHVCAFVLNKVNPSGLTHSLPILTMAAMLHDATLSDHVYELKSRLLQTAHPMDLKSGNSDEIELFTHPLKGAQLSKEFPFCHSDVATVITQHHEKPDGRGFPQGLKETQIHPLAAFFIVCEDFVEFFMKYYPKPDWAAYLKLRSATFSSQPFLEAFSVLKDSVS